jgi:NAD(P)H dehydrogenase (quinone)
MPKVLVLFHSRTGRTAAIADAIARGAESVKFTEVELRRIDDLSPQHSTDDETTTARAAMAKKYRVLESVESLTQYDALIIGSPARYGGMSAELEHTLDQAEALWRRGALVDKVASAFGSSDARVPGLEPHAASMIVALAHLGMIVVPPLSYRASATTASLTDQDAAVIAAAEQQGARVAKVAEWVRHAKSHEAHGHHH